MDIEEMKKTMLEDPAAELRDNLKIVEKFNKAEKLEITSNQINKNKENNTTCPIKEAVTKNTDNYLNDIGLSDDNSVNAQLIKDLVPKIFDNLAAKHFVGIQPMQGPVGLVYSLEYLAQELTPIIDEEFAGAFAEAKNTKQKISLNIVSNAIEAHARKLETSIEIEPMMDDNLKCHKNSKKYDTTNDIAKEIYTEIRNDITAVAHKHSVIIKDDYNPFDLRVVINYCANEIARKTRRGAGNFIIASETVTDILKDSMGIDPDLIYHSYGYVNYVGTIGVIDVYRDLDIEYNKTIIGYKGKNGETDAGYFYAPYVPLMATVVVNPTTFQPVVSLMTRYGKYINQLSEESVSDDGTTITITKEKCNYYYELTFENLPKPKDVKFKKDEKDEKEKTKDVLESASDVFGAAMQLLD